MSRRLTGQHLCLHVNYTETHMATVDGLAAVDQALLTASVQNSEFQV
jgi:hypothetical protein